MSFDTKMDENPGLGCQNDIGDEIETWDNHGCEIHDEAMSDVKFTMGGAILGSLETCLQITQNEIPKGPEQTPAGWYRNSWTILL